MRKQSFWKRFQKPKNKNESHLNIPNKKTQLKVTFYTQTYRIEKKMYHCRCQFWQFGGLDLARERTVYGSNELYALSLLIVADFSLSPVPTPCLLCSPFCLGFGLQNHFLKLFDFIASLSLLLSSCTHCLSLFLSWCTFRFRRELGFVLW